MNALGGKDQIAQISSVLYEGTLDVMGSQGTVKTTLLNGKGYKQEIDVMGTVVVMCYTDSMGWQINPMGGNYNRGKNGRQSVQTGPGYDFCRRTL